MTRFIGLTGGIGAGKSEALAAFGRLGAATLSTDKVAHDLLDDDGVRSALVERWGADVARGDEVDRARIAQIVFERPDELRWLEAQLHPRVGEAVMSWREQLEPDVNVAVVEVPLLFEAAMEDAFDATIAVIADDEIRESRLAERGQAGLSGRQGRQLDQTEKAKRADYVLRNDGTLEELERDAADVLGMLESQGTAP